jgi:hypothetical protein
MLMHSDLIANEWELCGMSNPDLRKVSFPPAWKGSTVEKYRRLLNDDVDVHQIAYDGRHPDMDMQAREVRRLFSRTRPDTCLQGP